MENIVNCKSNCLHCTEKCNTKSNTEKQNQYGNCELKDNEIIKALECCIKGNHCRSDCPYDSEDDSCIECTSKLAKDTLNLINRKNAEIERLKKQLDAAEYCIREVDVALYHGSYNDYCGELIEKYNNFVKEMTE